MTTANNNITSNVVSAGGITYSGSTTGWVFSSINNQQNPDFVFTLSISDEIRRRNPKEYYYMIALFSEHVQNFKGKFPFESEDYVYHYETEVSPDASLNAVDMRIIIKRDKKDNNGDKD